MKQQLIITGDDYGLCAPVNTALEECLAAGAMRATCVMANMPECGAAASLRKKFPRASLGIHWNLTQGRPVLGAARVPSLVDGNGWFSTDVRRRWIMKRIDAGELQAELRAQYERFRELCGPADFWNTHQDVHVYPGLFQRFVELGIALKIPAMRSHERHTLPARGSAAAYNLRHPLYWAKGRLIHRWCVRARGDGMRMPAGRLYLPGYQPGNYTLSVLLQRFDWRGVNGPLELVIHPATALDPSLGGLQESRLREHKLFRDARLLGQIERAGVRVVGFNGDGSEGGASHREKAA
jgi:chitin disaccharide deacetylase